MLLVLLSLDISNKTFVLIKKLKNIVTPVFYLIWIGVISFSVIYGRTIFKELEKFDKEIDGTTE